MQTLRWIVAGTVFAALLFLSLQNAESVTLRFFNVASWHAPLVLVVFVAFAIGVAAGLLAGAMRASRLKRQLSRLRHEHRASPALKPAADAVPPRNDPPPDAV
ncbi:MAG: LapA family protein [Burkholderiales bacterium]|nr:LapA family protein [Burkholderiales bacterium]